MKYVIATHNKGKLVEFQRLLEPMGIEAVPMDLSEPDETGRTFAENAFIKAEAACKETGLPAVADDSGLCVDYLGGAPGGRVTEYSTPPRKVPRAGKPVGFGGIVRWAFRTFRRRRRVKCETEFPVQHVEKRLRRAIVHFLTAQKGGIHSSTPAPFCLSMVSSVSAISARRAPSICTCQRLPILYASIFRGVCAVFAIFTTISPTAPIMIKNPSHVQKPEKINLIKSTFTSPFQNSFTCSAMTGGNSSNLTCARSFSSRSAAARQ